MIALKRELRKFDTNQENSSKSNNDQWKDNLKTIGIIGLAIVVVVLVVGFIRTRVKSN
jgi:hypothetical protein